MALLNTLDDFDDFFRFSYGEMLQNSDFFEKPFPNIKSSLRSKHFWATFPATE